MLIGLHTDHCTADRLDGYLRPLLAISLERKRRGENPLFNSHMFDGSTLPLEQNLEIAVGLLEECVAADIVLEVECGVVGGEEDGVSGEDAPWRSSTRRPRTCSGWPRCSAPASAAATCWRRPSGTSTACTRPGT